MTKADICNVAPDKLDDLLGVVRMLIEASHDHLDALEYDDACWTVVDGMVVE